MPEIIVFVVLGIILFVIGLMVTEYIIRTAIDNSQTAENIKEIRKILSKQYQTIDDSNENTSKDDM